MLNQNTDYLSNVIFSGKYITNIVYAFIHMSKIYLHFHRNRFFEEKKIWWKERTTIVYGCAMAFFLMGFCVLYLVLFI
jgi:hypothetical protein